MRLLTPIITLCLLTFGAGTSLTAQDSGDIDKTEKADEKVEEKVENTNPADPKEPETDPAEQGELVTKLSITATERLLKSMELEFEEIGNGIYRFELDDYKVLLYNKKKALQMYAGFSGFDVTLGRINEWNRTKRFSKAYLDDDDDPCLESDLDLEGGVATAAIEEFIETFRVSVEMFRAHITD